MGGAPPLSGRGGWGASPPIEGAYLLLTPYLGGTLPPIPLIWGFMSSPHPLRGTAPLHSLWWGTPPPQSLFGGHISSVPFGAHISSFPHPVAGAHLFSNPIWAALVLLTPLCGGTPSPYTPRLGGTSPSHTLLGVADPLNSIWGHTSFPPPIWGGCTSSPHSPLGGHTS